MASLKQRFFINPLANSSNITASSQGAGSVTTAKKTGTGSATLTPSGSYTGSNNKLVTWQIDSLGTGEIGSSTYRWKTSDTVSGWEATGQATSTSTISLGSEGIEFTLTGGAGADFVLNDKWQWWVYSTFSPANLFVNDRDEYYKSGAYTSETPEFENVTNGTFATDITGWTHVGVGSAAWDTGTLKLTNGASNWDHAYQLLSLDEGKRYYYSVEVTASDTLFGFFAIGTTVPTIANYSGQDDVLTQVDCDSVYTYTGYFTAGATNYFVVSNGGGNTKYINFDNITIKEVNCRLTIDLGSAQSITAVAALDHNLVSGNWIAIQGNSSDSWESPAYELQLDETNDPEIEYISQTYRYLSLEVSGYDDYFSLGKLYLGTYTEVSDGELYGGANYGSANTQRSIEETNESLAGKETFRILSDRQEFPLVYTWLTSTELATLKSVWDFCRDVATGLKTAIFIHYWYGTNSTLYYVYCVSDWSPARPRGGFSLELNFRESVITRTI